VERAYISRGAVEVVEKKGFVCAALLAGQGTSRRQVPIMHAVIVSSARLASILLPLVKHHALTAIRVLRAKKKCCRVPPRRIAPVLMWFVQIAAKASTPRDVM